MEFVNLWRAMPPVRKVWLDAQAGLIGALALVKPVPPAFTSSVAAAPMLLMAKAKVKSR